MPLVKIVVFLLEITVFLPEVAVCLFEFRKLGDTGCWEGRCGWRVWGRYCREDNVELGTRTRNVVISTVRKGDSSSIVDI